MRMVLTWEWLALAYGNANDSHMGFPGRCEAFLFGIQITKISENANVPPDET